MIVKLELDPKLVWRLEEQAEKAGLTFNEHAAARLEGKRQGLWSTSRAAGEITKKRVAELHAQGLTDAEISAAIERVIEHVAFVRRNLGLKPNRGQRVGT